MPPFMPPAECQRRLNALSMPVPQLLLALPFFWPGSLAVFFGSGQSSQVLLCGAKRAKNASVPLHLILLRAAAKFHRFFLRVL